MVLKEEKVRVISWKKKASVWKETYAVSRMRVTIVRKNQNPTPPHFPSQPYHEVKACRGREESDAKVTMDPFFDNRVGVIKRVLARERLVNMGIRPSANFFSQKRVVSQETRVCFLTSRLMNNQIKGRRKETLPKKKRKWRQRRCGFCEKRITIGLYYKTQMHSTLKEQKSFGETRCKKSWTQFKELDSRSLRYVTRVSGTRKDHRLEKYKSNLDISEVLTLQNSKNRSPEETERQERCAQSKAWDLAKNISSSKRTTRLHYSRLQSGFSQVHHQGSRVREIL